MTSRPAVHLTRRAALDLQKIYRRSLAEWGQDVAKRYMHDLYLAMNRAAIEPESGRLRHIRSAPFMMVAARRHFIVYDPLNDGIVVLTVLHQVRDIETLILEMSPSLFLEISRLKSGS
ncbi:type II toxin-antitoxin system RelE/ParE family toxin [Mesorhizobium australicum]|uniref:Plasmid stabilization system protein ParE n=1 Tax=Mesorhizobium australicum TaxID=536018 RepID=A0A1X7PFH2_9HYPH|nr:type II toxin-antitoxin system RelE/ParE family toxin [Mesorhizobium australicum]SMH49944.1 Plasmid stabilization system protein ParE [Mesorhizobium australicum]